MTEVLSPTFNLLYEYDINNFKVMHFDLYRIKETKEMDNIGIFSDEKDTIKIIEWPQLIEADITDRLELHLSYASNENERNLSLKGKGKWRKFKLDEFTPIFKVDLFQYSKENISLESSKSGCLGS